MRRHTQLTWMASSLLALVVSVASSWAQPASIRSRSTAESCERRQLTPGPGWTVSGAWTSDGKDLLLVDTKSKRVLRYSGDGKPQGSIPATESARLENFSPARIAVRDNSELLLEMVSGRFVALDRSYTPNRRKNFLAEGVRDGVQVTSTFSWNIAGTDVISLSDLKGPGSTEWRTAFVRIPFDEPAGFSILQPLPKDTTRDILRLGYNFVATVGTTAYILTFDDGARIYRNVKGSTDLVPLSAFPEDFELTPILPRVTRLDFPVVMAAMEKTAMAVGLYAWKGDLWVLTRRPEGNATRWELIRINPDRDQVLGTAVIPTRANHLTVVPGSLGWAFVEKGPVRAFEDQDIKTYLYVPASRISRIGNGASGDVCQ